MPARICRRRGSCRPPRAIGCCRSWIARSLTHVFGKLDKHRAALTKKKLRFSVNLSGPSIGDPDFIEWLGTHIGGGGVPGDWLQFEITETAAVANVAQTQALMRRLKARGVQFALDDFGTGVSSFAYLKFFDVNMLKLDGSFVRDLLAQPALGVARARHRAARTRHGHRNRRGMRGNRRRARPAHRARRRLRARIPVRPPAAPRRHAGQELGDELREGSRAPAIDPSDTTVRTPLRPSRAAAP